MTTERQSDKTVSDIEVQMKQRSFTELLHDVKIALIDIHQCLLNVCGDQPVDVSAVRGVFQQWWQWCERQTTFWIAMHRCHATKWRLFWPAHPQESENYYHVTVYGAECQLQCTRNNGGNTGILQCLCQIVPTNAHMGTERTLYMVCQDLLNQYQAEGDSSLDLVITSDEMWCHHYESESKQQSLECEFPIKKKKKSSGNNLQQEKW